MPYTRNTRIKVVHHKYKDEYIAQVEYRIPFTKISWWLDFKSVEPSILILLTNNYPSPFEAHRNCLWDEEANKLRGLDWAKAIIDEYHKLMDEKEHKDTVEYIKYP